MDYEFIISRLEIVPIKELKAHEERIHANIIRLKEGMLNLGHLVDPIIIDRKHRIVLDGNHRLKVLEIIKVPNSVCQVVDYEDPEIKIGSWYPTSERLNKELLTKPGIKLEKVDFEQGKKEITNKKAAFMLVNKKEYYLVNPGNYSLDGLIKEQQEILKKIGNDFAYISDDMIEKEINNGKGVLFRKIYTKEEIIEKAMKNELFPPKSTRHLVPNRIIRLNMKLGWLHQDLEEVQEHLRRLLKNRVYSGNVRRYVEPVIVIY